MIVLPVAPNLETPEVFSLELGIAQKMQGWIAQFWQGPHAVENRHKAVSYQQLKKLAGLVPAFGCHFHAGR
jgi:hypothetical protein